MPVTNRLLKVVDPADKVPGLVIDVLVREPHDNELVPVLIDPAVIAPHVKELVPIEQDVDPNLYCCAPLHDILISPVAER